MISFVAKTWLYMGHISRALQPKQYPDARPVKLARIIKFIQKFIFFIMYMYKVLLQNIEKY